MIDRIQFSTGEADGDAGLAETTGYSPHVSGKVEAVAVSYAGAAPATTTLTIRDEGDPVGEPLVQLAMAHTDTKIYVRAKLAYFDGDDAFHNAEGYPLVDHFVVHGRLQAVLTQSNPGCSALITVWLER